PEESERTDPGPGWSEARAEKAFFERLAREERQPSNAQPANGIRATFRRILLASCLDALCRRNPAFYYTQSLCLLGRRAARYRTGKDRASCNNESTAESACARQWPLSRRAAERCRP